MSDSPIELTSTEGTSNPVPNSASLLRSKLKRKVSLPGGRYKLRDQLVDEGFEVDDAAAAASYASSLASAHEYLSRDKFQYDAGDHAEWPKKWPANAIRPAPRADNSARRSNSNSSSDISRLCKCDDECMDCFDHKSAASLCLALWCPAVAVACFDPGSIEHYDEGRPGDTCACVLATLIAQVCCCHVGGVCLAWLIITRPDD